MSLVIARLHPDAVVPDPSTRYITALEDPVIKNGLVTYRTGLRMQCDEYVFSIVPVNSLAGTGMIMVNCNVPMSDTHGELLVIFRVVGDGHPYVKGDHIACLQIQKKPEVKIKVNG